MKGNCIRIIDLFDKVGIDAAIAQLENHIEHGVLTLKEKLEKGMIDGASINIIPDLNLISVYSVERRKDLKGNHDLVGITRGYNGRVGVIIDSPVEINPRNNGNDYNYRDKHHLVIDGEKVPLEDRKIVGIVISEINIGNQDKVDAILHLATKKGLPVYSMDHGFDLKRV